MNHRLLVAAILAATLGLSATAQASTVELKSDGTLTVLAAAGEQNNIHIKPEGVAGLRVRDFGAKLTSKTASCAANFDGEVICRSGIQRVNVALGDDNDIYVAQHGFAAVVECDAGNDLYLHDGKTGVTTTRTDFRGGDGRDTATYSPATAGVIVTKDGVANDGRTITGTTVIDRDNVRADVEKLIGSAHNDSLNGSSVAPFGGKLLEEFAGGAGSDIMTGGPSEDFFDMSGGADGADFIRAGGGQDTVSDDVTGVERVFGGAGDDTISQVPLSGVGVQFFGGIGDDRLIGASGNDLLVGEGGFDLLTAGPGADTILAVDGLRDDRLRNQPRRSVRLRLDRRVRGLGPQLRELERRQARAQGLGQRRDAQLDAPEGLAQAALGHRPRPRRPADRRRDQHRPAPRAPRRHRGGQARSLQPGPRGQDRLRAAEAEGRPRRRPPVRASSSTAGWCSRSPRGGCSSSRWAARSRRRRRSCSASARSATSKRSPSPRV